jgi:hypothetical protein
MLQRRWPRSPSSVGFPTFHREPDRCFVAITKGRHQPNDLVRPLIAMSRKCGDPVPVEIEGATNIFRRIAPINFGDHAGLRGHSPKPQRTPAGGSAFSTTSIWRAGGNAVRRMASSSAALTYRQTITVLLAAARAVSSRSLRFFRIVSDTAAAPAAGVVATEDAEPFSAPFGRRADPSVNGRPFCLPLLVA